MSKILFVTSSLFGEQSKSREIALEMLTVFRDADPKTEVVQRDVNGLSHLSGDTLQALVTVAENRHGRQAELVRLADRLIEEVEAADTILITAPMYNFSISSHDLQKSRTKPAPRGESTLNHLAIGLTSRP